MNKSKLRKINIIIFTLIHSLSIMIFTLFILFGLIPYPSPLSVILALFLGFLLYSILPVSLIWGRRKKGDKIKSDTLKKLIDSTLKEVGLNMEYSFIPTKNFNLALAPRGELYFGMPLLLILNDIELKALLLEALEPFVSGKVKRDGYLRESLNCLTDLVDSIAWKDSAVKAAGSVTSGATSGGGDDMNVYGSMAATAETARDNKMTIFNILLFPLYKFTNFFVSFLVKNHNKIISDYSKDRVEYSRGIVGRAWDDMRIKLEQKDTLFRALKGKRYSMESVIPELMEEFNTLFSRENCKHCSNSYSNNQLRSVALEMERSIKNNFIYKQNLSMLNFVT